MNILITGGAGFIGSSLARKLLLDNHQITIVDNLHPYYSPEQKREHVNEVKSLGIPFQFIKVDLVDEISCKKVFEEGSFDVVVHLAALPGVPYSIKQPHQYIDLDIKMTVNVLKYAGETKVNHFIFASSSSVYGNQTGAPLTEEMANGQVASPYAAAKYGAESFCHAYQSLYGFQLTILRFFTVYGPWGRPDMAIPLFIRKLMAGDSLDIYGYNSARDYTYIDDIVNGIERTILYSKNNDTYNLGYGEPVYMEKLLDHLKSKFPRMKINQLKDRRGDVKMTWSNITKAKEKLGYNPLINIEEGLDITIRWAKKHFNR
ncbi:NAD-dependent epimerase/dehydratase family protein [Virgibacillus sp. DJP39]|uniref:NAD-dependent epimerase/dehydratase family protein n=1 Tax=Virgibacillus sp. DJP39 TaxID=3409790 RepID=UPI003BB7A509